MASRAVAAILGGYAFIWLLTAATTLLLTRVLGASPLDSVLAVTMSSFLIWAVVAMAVFHARSARRAWAVLLLGGFASALVLLVMTGRPWP
ncbi:MAG: hypothetical protein U1C74_05025 [Phenylobacterium sp.]|nr:hypothetical protein [Phenylobacterium sp.]